MTFDNYLGLVMFYMVHGLAIITVVLIILVVLWVIIFILGAAYGAVAWISDLRFPSFEREQRRHKRDQMRKDAMVLRGMFGL